MLKFDRSVTEIKSEWMPILYVVYCHTPSGHFNVKLKLKSSESYNYSP